MGESFFAAILALAIFGCAILGVRGQQARFSESARFLGTVRAENGCDRPLVVVLARWDGETATLVDHFVRDCAGSFFFTASAGTYVISAFEDSNANLRYDPDEPAIPLAEAPVLEAGPGEVVSGIELVVRADRRAAFHESLDVSALVARTRNDQQNLSFGHLKVRGDVVPLSDSRFAPKNAKRGLWEPFDFLLEVGAGVYLLQPYEPEKTPVLFVHGISGSPRDFELLIERLDRSRFQPWVFYYPSGVYLDRVAGHLVEILVELRIRFGFRRVALVAHSMGGLLSRAALLEGEASGGDLLVDTFVSISTPWEGHEGASVGVDRAPVVVYSWEDLAPESRFLREIFSRRLPEGVCHDLIFSYKRRSRFPGVSSDQVISLASQLRLEAQAEARSVFGINSSHLRVLRSRKTAAWVNDRLAQPCP